MDQLDRNRPHATIYGDADGRSFQQGDNFFRFDGSLWVGGSAPEVDVAVKPKRDKPQPKVAVNL